MAEWPQGLASTDFWLRIPCYHLLESVTVKPPVSGWKVGSTPQGVSPDGHPQGPLVNGICTLPPHVRYIPEVTLILVEF
jgi:hypothetical protein